ncbi:MAG: LytTR family transcriptional regulator DNA-binding domain-containing protein [Lachnospiraceae bacterium]|nr:LytTR family transcriptional regulator DNA-binding domain-containing protein [Lachnospiraceae bacterium]
MENRVNISFETDPSCEFPQVIIKADKRTEKIDKIIEAIEKCVHEDVSRISVSDGDSIILLEQKDIMRVYTENRKVVVCTDDKEYESKITLREFEEILDKGYFVRISRFEIINLQKVFSFDLSMSGTIRVIFDGASETWVARRYVKDILRKLDKMNKGEV